MPKIDLDKYPKIKQTNPQKGCIPVNIENALKYYGENGHDEASLLKYYEEVIKALGFKEAVPHLEALLPDFEFIFKGKIDFENSIDNVITYIKSNIDLQIPVLVSFKVRETRPIWIPERGLVFKVFENAHIRTAIEYNDTELLFFDPGDGGIRRFNYTSNNFSDNIKGDYHTLVIKRKE